MTLYLTDDTSPDEVVRAKAAGIRAFKLYPAGATTNSGMEMRRNKGDFVR
jgi:dihydroorotase